MERVKYEKKEQAQGKRKAAKISAKRKASDGTSEAGGKGVKAQDDGVALKFMQRIIAGESPSLS